MLDGIDDIDWAALEHAYGPADDVPDLLRAAGSPDPGARAGALDELYPTLCHQGSVYSATAAAVPFVARLALDGPGDRPRLLWLLHGAARGTGREHRRVRRAVAVAFPSLLDLAADEDPSVRRAMVWITAALGEASLPLLPLLRARLEAESDPRVRADVVTALGLLDVSPRAGEARNRALLSDPEPLVRRAAATDLLRTAPLPLPVGLVDAALDAHGAPVADDAAHHPWPGSYRPLEERLMDDPDAAMRAVERGAPLAWRLTEAWRDREEAVLPWLAEAAAEAVDGGAGGAEKAGGNAPGGDAAGGPTVSADAAARGTEALCRVARVGAALRGGQSAPWLEPLLRSDDPAVRVAATNAAVRLRVPGAVGLVLRLMDELPEEAAEFRLTPLSAPGTVVPAAVEVFGPAAEPVARRVAAGPRTAWLDALRPFPVLAAGCVDALIRLLPASAGVLAGLGPAAGPAAVRALRDLAGTGDLSAASALARLTGETGPVLDVVRASADDGARRTAAVRVAARLGPPAAALLPLLEEEMRAPSGTDRAAAATAVWRVTGRTHDTAPVVAGRLASAGDLYEPHLGALRTLAAMGVLPGQARPAVRRIALSARRVVPGFPCDGTPHPDLEARRLARRLLAATG
ncbi:HEAT repeat domain-containing protein [Streptomyces lavendulocolor]|uniref:HEAT repeat domain-containing protein n=1 Tax=Streptomyces lavendulocolor TaxID=67316 RepID=UPI0033F387F1